MESVRVLALAAQEGCQVHHMDAKSAFLNGISRRRSTCATHLATPSPEKRGRCTACARHSMACARHRAPRTRSSMPHSRRWASSRAQHEAAVYRRGNRCNVLMVGIYVDDLIITGAEEQKVEVFKA
ncbi:uncharacterized protein [Miscanthus floridulus]|uniref:uncharacterized protein n=1 Tax=Miscanthus floridulus TaxID=154761 RepID=UPI003459D4E3